MTTRPDSIELAKVADASVVYLPQDLFDQLAILTVKEDLLEFAEHERPMRLIISFDRVTTCGSEAVGALMRLAHRVRGYGGDVRLCSMSERIREVFDICRLIDTVFQLYPTTAEAAQSFSE